MYTKLDLNWKVLLNEKFSKQFGEKISFTIVDFPHIFSLVNFFLAALLQALYLVTQMVFFQKG